MLEQTTNSLSKVLTRHQQGTKFALTAISASALTAIALFAYQNFARRWPTFIDEPSRPRQPLAVSIIKEDETNTREFMDESLVLEFLARNTAFLGDQGVSKIRNSFVVVLGSGSIGSYAALMLVRSGFQHVRIVDKSLVRLETLGCHAIAKTTDIGDPDFVVDTLPYMKDKIFLANYCKKKNIKIISSMSAGGKADPTQIQLTDISHSTQDPLSRMYRRQLKKSGVDRDIPVVFSLEKSINFDRIPDFNTRSLPIMGPVAGMFGMALTTYIILEVSGFKAYDLPQNKSRDGVYSRIQKELAGKEEFTFGNKVNILNTSDIAYIFDELWQGKSAFSGSQDRSLVMTRWNISMPSSLVNTILVTKEEAKKHEELPLDTDLQEHYGLIADNIEKQFNLENKLQKLWESY